MRYISVFSGIEAASVAWGPLGWEPVAFCEIDPFPSAVLAHRYPNVPNLGDITKVDWKEVIAEHGAVDVVVGGSPCQSFSIAGGREGLDGESRLMYEYIRCVQDVRPRWFLWENVPGVFSIDGGRAYGILLRAMEELGYGMAWRVLDAQFFGVAQRRRRVFLVGHIGDGFAPAAVLFEPESVSGNTQSSREKRQELARAAGRGASGGGGGCLTPWDVQSKRVFMEHSASPSLQSGTGEGVNIQPSILTFAQNVRGEVRVQGDGSMSGALSAEQSPSLTADYHNPAVLSLQTDHLSQNGTNVSTEVCKTLDVASQVPVVMTQYGEVAGSLTARADSSPCVDRGQNIVCTGGVVDRQSVVCLQDGQANGGICDDHAPTLNAMHEQPIVIDRAAFSQGKGALFDPAHRADGADGHAGCEGSACGGASNGEDVVSALCARDWKGVGNQYVTDGKVVCQPTS